MKLQKAIFLDRDGVLIRERGDYNYLPEHLIINQGLGENLQRLQEAGFVFVVISNQGGIAKGLYTMEDFERLNKGIQAYLHDYGLEILAFYGCPHHPDRGRCLCRKPLPLLIEKAIARFSLNPGESFFIGDALRDMQAAEAAGVRGLKIEANEDLARVVETILNARQK